MSPFLDGQPARDGGMAKIPYPGFRLVFGLINGVVWLVLTYAILSGVTSGMAAAGRLSASATTVCAATVAFFVCFFGLPGAIGGFLDPARQGRIALPPAATWGPGRLALIHRVGFTRGLLTSALVAPLAWAYLSSVGLPSRNRLCWMLAALAAVLATLHTALLAGRATLGDLHPRSGSPPAPSPGYLVWRFALPQGGGNAIIGGLIATGVLPASAAGVPARMAASAVAVDALVTALVIGTFMLAGAGGLARVDRRFGRIASLAEKPPARALRVLLLVAVSAVAAGLGFAFAWLSAPGGLALVPFVAWKTLLCGAVASVLAAYAARWALGPE